MNYNSYFCMSKIGWFLIVSNLIYNLIALQSENVFCMTLVIENSFVN